MICHDINESIRRLLLEGSVDFTIPQDFEQQGYLPLILLRDYLRQGGSRRRQDGQEAGSGSSARKTCENLAIAIPVFYNASKAYRCRGAGRTERRKEI